MVNPQVTRTSQKNRVRRTVSYVGNSKTLLYKDRKKEHRASACNSPLLQKIHSLQDI